jgi:hypothetical protein
MRNKINILLVIFVLCGFGLYSCQDRLSLSPKNAYDSQSVWNDVSLTRAFVNDLYKGLPEGFKGNRRLASYTDEALLTFNYNTEAVNKSLITPTSYYDIDDNGQSIGDYTWANVYKNIRKCNIFFKNIRNSTTISDDVKNELIGEVHFLRAFYYQLLVAMYGGVPIITKVYELGQDYSVSRNTYAESIKFIVDECDSAASSLPLEATEKGRATKGAALALKSRVLLYAASGLHNSAASWAPSYDHPELVGYVNGDRTAEWRAAKKAAKAVMDLDIYHLYKPNPQPGDDIAQNYDDIFFQKENPEHIFVKYFITKNQINNIARYLAPNGWHCYSGDTPTEQMVDAYEMKDGSKFSWNNPEEAAHPYENREPRFYASILYDGAYFRQRPPDIRPSDTTGRYQAGPFEEWNSKTNSIDVVPGLDTRKSPFEDWNGSYTGYTMLKFVDPAVDGTNEFQDNPWIYFRYTEVLLNYAEACIGLGQDAEARKYINKIRKRAGLPDINSSGKQLEEDLRHERRIELAFEGRRFFDIRRWMIGAKAYQDVKGMTVYHKLNSDKITHTPVYKVSDVWERNWDPKFYFLPIKLKEMHRNSKLIQNPGY